MFKPIKTYAVTSHLNCLSETVLLMGHNICFYGEMRLIIFELSLLPFLIWSTGLPFVLLIFGTGTSSWEANRKSQKLFTFVTKLKDMSASENAFPVTH